MFTKRRCDVHVWVYIYLLDEGLANLVEVGIEGHFNLKTVRLTWCRGVYFSKNQYFFTNPKNGPARDSRDTLSLDSNISAYGEIFTSGQGPWPNSLRSKSKDHMRLEETSCCQVITKSLNDSLTAWSNWNLIFYNYWHYIANGEEPLVEEQENTEEEKSDSKASEADADFCKGMSKHVCNHY